MGVILRGRTATDQGEDAFLDWRLVKDKEAGYEAWAREHNDLLRQKITRPDAWGGSSQGAVQYTPQQHHHEMLLLSPLFYDYFAAEQEQTHLVRT